MRWDVNETLLIKISHFLLMDLNETNKNKKIIENMINNLYNASYLKLGPLVLQSKWDEMRQYCIINSLETLNETWDEMIQSTLYL